MASEHLGQRARGTDAARNRPHGRRAKRGPN
jgi:hypothetical protein